MNTDRAESGLSSGGNGRQSAMQSQPRTPGRIGLPGTILSRAEQKVHALHVAGVPSPVIAERLGLAYSSVRTYLGKAKQRLRGERAPMRQGYCTPKRHQRDAGWTDRQVAYLLTLEEDRANHYLNGIQIVWGESIRAEVESRVSASPETNCKQLRGS